MRVAIKVNGASLGMAETSESYGVASAMIRVP